MRDRVEVFRQIGVHHVGVAPAQQPVHFLDRVGPAPSRADSHRHCPRGPPRRSAPAPAWPRSAPPGPGSSGCRAGVRRRRASGSSPAAPVGRYVFVTSSVPQARQPLLHARRLDHREASPRPRPALPRWRGPAHRHGAECPRGKSCRRAGRSGRPAPPSPCNTASSEGSGSYPVLPGSSPITDSSPSSKARQKSGSFPPPALPGFSGTMTLSDSRRAAVLRRRRGRYPRPDGSPPLPGSPSRRAVPITPADQTGALSVASPSARPSPYLRRVGIRDFTFEACSGFTRVTARRVAQPPKAAFVTRLRPGQLPSRTARQLPELPTTLWVEPSSTGDPRPSGRTAKSGKQREPAPDVALMSFVKWFEREMSPPCDFRWSEWS